MAEWFSEELRSGPAEEYDVFLSFTRASPGSVERIELLDRALRDRGLRVFRDVCVDEFDSITAGLARALAGSKILLAYYTREYPRRYACQWELTAAFVAAQREGDPRRRVLVINPEDDTDHLAPIELADAKYSGARTPVEIERLTTRVAEMVAAARGPLGAPPDAFDRARLPAEVLRPARFVGRYPQMWEIHSAVNGMDLPGAHEPGPASAVLVSGITGTGKSSLAARYAYLYRDAYPGGIFWTGPVGGSATDAAGRFTAELRRVAAGTLGLEVDGVEPARLRRLVADFLGRTGRKVLWIVDDIPPGMPNEDLEQLLIPAAEVRTVLTCRSGAPDWDVRSIVLDGLTDEDALALFGRGLSAEDRQAVRDFTRRCGGHPFVLRSVANKVPYHPATPSGADVDRLLRTAASTVAETVRRDLADLPEPAMSVLRVAAVLAPAPFARSLVARVLGTGTGGGVPDAVEELVRRGLLNVVGTGWEVHALVSETVEQDADLREIAELTAATLLDAVDPDDPHLVKHARELGGRADMPARLRLPLLRHVVEHHEAQGDPVAAVHVVRTLLGLGGGVPDLLTAARVAIAAGRPRDAETHAREAIRCAAATDDYRARDRARLLLAQALDQLGRLDEADAAFWTGVERRPPAWMDARERTRTSLALTAAKLLRGFPKDALAIVEPIVKELRATPPGPAGSELAAVAKLEYARLLQLTGKARNAREIAWEVVTFYRDRRMGAHARLLEAEGVWADAFLTLDLLELDGKQENWERAESKLRELSDTYATKWGEASSVALAARVRADRALLAIGEPAKALRALAATEQEVLRHLGRHRLWFRVRHAIGLAHAQLYEFDRQREVLRGIVDQQAEQLGRNHPETVESLLDLGIALALTGERTEAIRLVDNAARTLRRSLGFDVDLSGKATMAQWVLRLPHVVLMSMMAAGKLFGGGPKKESEC